MMTRSCRVGLGAAALLVVGAAASAAPTAVSQATPVYSVVDTITTGAYPWDVKVSANGTTVYVTDYGQGDLSIINAGSFARTPVGVGGLPGYVGVTPDGMTAYVTSYSDDLVSVVDVASATRTRTITGFADPWALAIDEDQYLYVFDYGGGSRPVHKVNLTTGLVDDSVSRIGYAWSATLSADGSTLYAPYPAFEELVVIRTSDMAIRGQIPIVGQPRFSVVSPDQASLYVTSNVTSGPAMISRLDTTNLTIDDSWPIASGGDTAAGIAISPDGQTLYVAVQPPNSAAGRVLAIDVATRQVEASLTVGVSPSVIAVSPDGHRVYVTNNVSDTLSVIEVSNPAPTPTPVPPTIPAEPPGNAVAIAGDASATVSWAAPASTGSFPVSHYQVTASPGGRSCLVSTPALTCEVTGLTNGSAYTFTVKALTGAGWSPESSPSNAVVPRSEAGTAIVITGSRSDRMIKVSGTATGMGMGGGLNPYVRTAGQSGFIQGSATILVNVDGNFEWSRRSGKRTSVYVATPDGSLRSNTVTISAR